MRLVINSATVATGGGLTEAANLIYTLAQQPSEHELFFLSPDIPVFKKLKGPGIKWIPVPGWLLWKPFRIILDRLWIPGKLKELSPDWVYTTGNLPARIVHYKQAFLFNNPFYTRDNLRGLNLPLTHRLIHKVRKQIFKRRLGFIDLIFAQTSLQQNLIIGYFSPEFPVYVLPNAPIALPQKNKNWGFPQRKKSELRLLVFSRYYPHKNLEILLEVAAMMREKGIKGITFILTLEPSQGKGATRMLQRANTEFREYFYNAGYVSPEYIESLYHECDGLLLPTLLESYSSTYADAMKFGKPILTSDRDFAHEVLGEAAWYFDPSSVKDIIEKITLVFSSSQLESEKFRLGKQICIEKGTWDKVSRTLFDLLEKET